ncbi:hypothetical protein HALA3H3_30168 [Halomonas sp. A3H3]|nr:hypothetical protein HALA3H3_30168 [Halomonas sp. A3H3]
MAAARQIVIQLSHWPTNFRLVDYANKSKQMTAEGVAYEPPFDVSDLALFCRRL